MGHCYVHFAFLFTLSKREYESSDATWCRPSDVWLDGLSVELANEVALIRRL